MKRRFLFFGAGALISIIFLSIDSENRMQKVFYENVDYVNPDKRIITQLFRSDSIVYFNEIGESSLGKFYDGAWVNYELTDKNSYPKFYVLENIVENENQRVSVNFYDREEVKIIIDTGKGVKDGTIDARNDNITEIINFEQGIEISSRSYKSYFLLIVIFLVIMIPVGLLVRKLIKKISL